MGAYTDVHETIHARKCELVKDIYAFEHGGYEVTRSSTAALQHAENVVRLSELNKLLDTMHTTVDWGEKE